MKTITLEITGEDAVIDAALDAFVRQYGWTEETEETQVEKARAVLRGFIMETVKAHNIKAAEDLARSAAATETEAALDTTTMTVAVA